MTRSLSKSFLCAAGALTLSLSSGCCFFGLLVSSGVFELPRVDDSPRKIPIKATCGDELTENGIQQARIGEWDKACDLFIEAAEAAQDRQELGEGVDSNTFYLAGLAYERRGQLGEARSMYERALALSPSHVPYEAAYKRTKETPAPAPLDGPDWGEDEARDVPDSNPFGNG